MRALKIIIDAAQKTQTPLTLCGEMGGKPIEALALLGLGFRGLSMSPASIGPVKAMILATDLAASARFVAGLVERHDGPHSVRDELYKFAKANAIPV